MNNLTGRISKTGRGATPRPSIKRQGRSDSAPLSYAQQRLWFLQQLDPDSDAYNISGAVRLLGRLDVKAMEKAIEEIFARHDVARATFHLNEDHPVQLIGPPQPMRSALVDLSEMAADKVWAEIERTLNAIVTRPFNLSRGALGRAYRIRLGGEDMILAFVMHHIISDGLSFEVIVREYAILYQAFTSGLPSPLPPLPIQYADYAVWQRELFALDAGKEHLRFWREYLEGAPPILDLPADRPRPAALTFRSGARKFRFGNELSEKLREFSKKEQVTLYMTLLAVFQTLLHKYSGRKDIVVGTPVSGRTHLELEGLIGLFVNTIPLRIDFSGVPSFRALVARVKSLMLDITEHQELPFEKIVEEIQPDRDISSQPVFQVVFTFRGSAPRQLSLPGLTITSLETANAKAKFDLSLNIAGADGDLLGVIEYNSDLFDSDRMERMVGHLLSLTAKVFDYPDQRLSQISLLTSEEERQILDEWNDVEFHFESEMCLPNLFQEQAKRFPDSVAVSYDGEALTYRELNSRANRWACYLKRQGVEPEIPVAIYVDRGLEMIIGLLAILKAGGAYVPLDTSCPPERLQFLMEDTHAPIILTQKKLCGNLPASSAKVIIFEDECQCVDKEDDENPPLSALPENSAYIIYTSGSTGRPKGVVVTHSNVVRLLNATDDWFHFNRQDVWTMFHSYAFDFSVWELWGALAFGGRLLVVPDQVSRSPDAFLHLLSRENVTVLNQTPSAFYQLIWVEESQRQVNLSNLRLVIFGGETLELKSLKPWIDRRGDKNPELVNMYGITETTVFVTAQPIRSGDADDHRGSLIGKRIPDLSVFLMDEAGQLSPVGIDGEIHVGGAGVARGYWNRPDLTAERFIPDGISRMKSGRLYRSGDLAYALPDGALRFLSRKDYQIKIRGYRIEPGEIEMALIEHCGAREAVVTVYESEAGGKQLIGYLVAAPDDTRTANELRNILRARLPDYMTPSVIIILDAFPLTDNGKVKRRALPPPDQEGAREHAKFIAPQTITEILLADIWTQLLDVEKVSVHDNFFRLGGHSLLATQCVLRVNKVFGVRIPLRTFFENPTVIELARKIDSARLEVERNAA
jgi:amino acid adenylation domain-containing protein